MMIHFWENTFWAKTSLSFIFRGPNSAHPEVFRCANCNGTSFKALWWSVSVKNTFWAKTSLSFIFRGPNSAHPEVFRCVQLQCYKFQSFMMIHFWENTFWAKTSLSLEFRGPNSAHPDVFRHANCNCTSFKAVWWSISKKTHFGLKHYFPLYLEGQTQHTLKFSGVPIEMVQVSKLYDDPFLRKHILG